MKPNFLTGRVVGGASQCWRRGGLGVRLAVWLCASLSFSFPSYAWLPSFNILNPPATTFVAPARLANDGNENLLVADPLAGKVVVLNATGAVVSVKSGLGQPLGLAVDDAGKIYVGDAKVGAVSVFDSQWNLLGHLGAETGEFQLPGHIATHTENGLTTVFVSDGLAHQVKAYRDGVRIGQYGSYGMGPTQFNFPAGIWIGPNAELFVVDQNNDRVQVLDRNGNFLRWFTLQPAPEQSLLSGRAQGIAGDAREGWLFVADTFQGQVKVFSFTGSFLGYVARYGDGAGELFSPGGLTVDGMARLWVANANNGRVEGFNAVQQPLLLWNRTVAGEFVLTWNDPRFDLQTSSSLAGPWQPTVGASPVTIPATTVKTSPQLFFRLQRR